LEKMTAHCTDTFSQSIVAEYIPFLVNVLTLSRLRHSLGVMQVMGELAEICHLDRTQALLAGLLRDAAKDLSVERQLALAEEAQIEFHHDCERHPVYLHAPVWFIKYEYKGNAYQMIVDGATGMVLKGDIPSSKF